MAVLSLFLQVEESRERKTLALAELTSAHPIRGGSTFIIFAAQAHASNPITVVPRCPYEFQSDPDFLVCGIVVRERKLGSVGHIYQD